MRSRTGEIRDRVREQTMKFLEEGERPMLRVRSPRGSMVNVLLVSCGLLELSINDSWERCFSWTSRVCSVMASDSIVVVCCSRLAMLKLGIMKLVKRMLAKECE
jgi:hypothetical protein